MSPDLMLRLAPLVLAAALLGAGPVEAADPWPLPAPDSCQPEGGLLFGPAASEDAATVLPFKPGDVFSLEQMELIKNFIPAFMWEYRERFFYEGMRLEIGPCFRDYGPPDFFVAATEKFAGQAKITDDNGIGDYTAGAPFPPAGIATQDPQAGIKWLWNVEFRYQAAGFRGPFRMTDLLGRIGRAEPFEGEMFKILIAHRADRPDAGYKVKGAGSKQFVAGGIFFKPFDAREYAWRQFRDVAHQTSIKRSDDLHAYVPQWRRVRRINANQVEGLYMPSFSVGVVPDQQLAMGTGGASGGMAAGGGVGGIGGTITAKRSGYEGLEIRPLLYDARVVGMHDVLTPINSGTPSYPETEDRAFGPWGLSFASDRWDLRRALVLELKTVAKATGGDQDARQLMYVDLQTFHPLYLATFDSRDEGTNVGIYVSRWSEDNPEYPPWPDDPERQVRVLDSVGAAFANLAESGSWRRESWNNISTPPPDRQVKRMLSVNELTKRR